MSVRSSMHSQGNPNDTKMCKRKLPIKKNKKKPLGGGSADRLYHQVNLMHAKWPCRAAGKLVSMKNGFRFGLSLTWGEWGVGGGGVWWSCTSQWRDEYWDDLLRCRQPLELADELRTAVRRPPATDIKVKLSVETRLGIFSRALTS